MTQYPIRTVSLALLSLGSLALCFVNPLAAQSPKKTADSKQKVEVDDVTWIDDLIRARWNEDEKHKIKPSATATDGEYIRRLYLDVLGRIPRAEEARAYIDSREKDKKVRVVEQLLTQEPWASEYARNWATIWSNLLIGRTPDRETSKEGMLKYLRDSFVANKPWNQMVKELLTATGGSHKESDQRGVPFNGAVNFLISHVGDRGTRNVPATSFSSRLFLGVQVQCTQCHDHPFNDRTQQAFWGFNAFFQQMDRREHNDTDDTGRRVFRFAELSDEPLEEGKDLRVIYERRNALIEATLPTFIDGVQIAEAATDLNLRERLADLIVSPQNYYFSQAIVNRIWAHFLGRGITHPLDDIGEHNPPSNPELFEKLAVHFQECNYDLKRLMRWIVLSEAYSLSSKATASNKEDDQLFSHYPLKQMRPEQFFDSLMVATQADKAGRITPEQASTMRQSLLQQFTQAFGNEENMEADTFNGTIPQALLMMNGQLIQQAISIEKGSFLRGAIEGALKKRSKTTELEVLNDLYLATVTRYPNPQEKAAAAKLIEQARRANKAEEAFQDIFWALLNSSEFVLNH
jgi:hypothetical protein